MHFPLKKVRCNSSFNVIGLAVRLIEIKKTATYRFCVYESLRKFNCGFLRKVRTFVLILA